MKRLALIVVAVLMGLTGVAAADPPSGGRGPNRACWQRAETLVRTGVEDVVYLDIGADVRQPAPRAFVCYMAPDPPLGSEPFAGVVSAWADPEYGNVGFSCAKRKGWYPVVPCDYNVLTLPAGLRGTTPVDHPYGPWGFHVLGVDVGYAFDSSEATVAVGTPGACARDTCVGSNGVRAGARRGLQYRGAGWRCTADSDGTCTPSDDPVGVTVGEQDDDPTLSIGSLELDLPATCVEASTTVRC